MQQNDDPRNIFLHQRQGYTEEPSQNQTHSQQTTNTSGAQGAQNSAGIPNGAGNSDYEQKVRQMKELAAKYEREGEGQLVKDILNNVIEQKAAGKLSNDQLIAFCKRISPLLNAEQRTRLNGLLQELLKI